MSRVYAEPPETVESKSEEAAAETGEVASELEEEKKEDEEGSEGVEGSGTSYVRITPSFILNYQARGLIRHLRTDVTIRVRGDESVAAVEENLPLIKNILVLLISQQDLITVSSPEGRFAMREAALVEIQVAMAEERPEAEIVEVLFTNFFVEWCHARE